MSKFVVDCEVVCEFSGDVAEKFILKAKFDNDKWMAEDSKGLLRVLDEKNIFKINNGNIKIGDYAYNPISDCINLIDEDDDVPYANETYYKVQNYKKPKENSHESNNS